MVTSRVGDVVMRYRTRAALSHPAFCGLDREHLGGLIEELAAPWTARRESTPRERRGDERKRTVGARPDHPLVFTGRVLVTVVYLRLQLPHAALAELYGVTRPTVTRAIHEIRPLQRHLGRREYYAETHAAIAGLVSDRAARRPTRPRTSAGSVPVWTVTC
ncbi:transposase family protein [Streptomyces sp. NPDC059788]|uniref:transposase family protein n=1 Tax=Streptomyces sp. NPDC059788 TaxID=3346948 RepID=UPI00364812CB